MEAEIVAAPAYHLHERPDGMVVDLVQRIILMLMGRINGHKIERTS